MQDNDGASAEVANRRPDKDRLGDTDTWTIPGGEVADRTVEAKFVGLGSSRATYHSMHGSDEHAEAGTKCQACRWLEIRIFDDGQQFTVSYVGRSDVPGEVQREWFMVTDTEDNLVDLLAGEGSSGGRFFSKPARMAIESARQIMPTIWDAYSEHPGNPAVSRSG